jgi:hypothetical protein
MPLIRYITKHVVVPLVIYYLILIKKGGTTTIQLYSIIPIIIVVFILYRIFLRVRRNIGWQLLNPRKMQVVTAIFFIIGLIFLVEGAFRVISLISSITGILIGAVFAYYGAGMTRFEKRDGQVYYRPNTWMGSLVTAIFLGQLIYSIYDMYTLTKPDGLQGRLILTSTHQVQTTSYDVATLWTSGLTLIMFAYYVVYNTILLRKH